MAVGSNELVIPAPGQLEFQAGFVDTELMTAVNNVVHSPLNPYGVIPTGQYVVPFGTKRNEMDTWLSDNTIPSPFRSFVSYILDSTLDRWETFGLYVRYINSGNALGIHRDGGLDLRTLIEGHSSTWVFDQQTQVDRYPEGLDLNSGDAVTINNRSLDNQLRHGVRVSKGIPFRLSYLFSFFH